MYLHIVYFPPPAARPIGPAACSLSLAAVKWVRRRTAGDFLAVGLAVDVCVSADGPADEFDTATLPAEEPPPISGKVVCALQWWPGSLADEGGITFLGGSWRSEPPHF